MSTFGVLALPRQIGSIETGPQAVLRDSGSRHPATDIRGKFRGIVAFMNRMLIPDHDHRAGHLAEQMHLDLPGGRQTPRPDQIQALGMFEAGAQHGRSPAPGPGAFERRDQRKPAFIGENQGCLALTPLFLSAARRRASNAEAPPRRVRAVDAGVSANSSPFAARAATRHWIHQTASGLRARRTTPKLHVPSDRPSNRLRHSQTHTHPCPGLFPTGGGAWATDPRGVPDRVSLSCFWG